MEPQDSEASVSRFEDLADELVYEIFDYLDVYHSHKAFYDLNRHFRNLLIHCALPLTISIASMSKAAFQHYHSHMIIPASHRITSMRLTNAVVVDLILSPAYLTASFTRLETLVLNGIKHKHLSDILSPLASLPHLRSLTVVLVHCEFTRDDLYPKIFLLPTLKYCKVSLEDRFLFGGSADPMGIVSPLEELIVNHSFDIDDLGHLSWHVPRLQRLTCLSLTRRSDAPVESFSFDFNALTHVSLVLMDISFDHFEPVLKNLSGQLLFLRLSTNKDQHYLNASRWERLIKTSMPQLQTFDLQHNSFTTDDIALIQTNYALILHQFSTVFWYGRRWFFEYQLLADVYDRQIHFYSTHPYRRKQFTLGIPVLPPELRHHERNDMMLVNSVTISSEQAITDGELYFPRAMELELSESFRTNRLCLSLALERVIPLNLLSTLIIRCSDFAFGQLAQLLSTAARIQTLVYACQPMDGPEAKSIQRTDIVQFVARRNRITKVTVVGVYSISTIQTLAALCPQVQFLTMEYHSKHATASLQWILSRCKSDLPSLCLICVQNATKSMGAVREMLNTTNELSEDYSITQIGQDLYLWW